MMTEQRLSLTPFYAGWDVYHQHLVAALAPLTSEQLALRSSPHTWSVGMITAHIIATRVWWFHRWMGVGNAELTPLGEWDEDGQPIRDAAELVTGLEMSWQMIQDALANFTPADLAQTFLLPDPTKEKRSQRSCQWIIWHVLEHDIHHGGELSSILGAHGLAAVDLD
jgi:uncharacterized damage-inducible protein DinB